MTTSAASLHTGGCRCGALRFGCGAEPHFAAICHCGDCRKASGAPFLAFVGFHRSAVTFEGGEGMRYGEAPVARSFCPTCGAPIAYFDERLPDSIYFVIGAMDTPQRFEPTIQAFAGKALPFACVSVDLPARAGGAVPRPEHP
ncbi:GFA family protein [Jiella sonneratiae]|uniref:GFA family protein n=1 Tax=Jiella sonneratiae TaxID=2816856 RepID=A0ABS3J205_9HYPH|nr:GFA family protein [Jiella sonneratiae]MBO0903705.1 GFA family protein [Jiella sonneratiae]